MKYKSIVLLTFIFGAQYIGAKAQNITDKTQYVNPYIGSEGHGHVFVGANVPFGAVQLGPSQIMRTWDKFNGWDWCSGYNYISEEILGFTHTHLSGTGIGDLNDILILPATGKIQLNPMKFEQPASGYGSYFSKNKEIVRPGFYSVYLEKYGVAAELTSSERVGMHHYHFDKTDNAHILVDLKFGMGWDTPVETYLTKINDSTFTGYRFSQGWAKDQRLYFAIRTSTPITKTELFNDTIPVATTSLKSNAVKAILSFDAAQHRDVILKVGISPVSSDNALANIQMEIPNWDFTNIAAQAKEKWNLALNKIDIQATDSVKTIFYTALYHTHFAPSLFNDANGDYRGTDKKVYEKQPFQNYTTYSLWDTYRAQHPLLTITDPDKVNDLMQSLIAMAQQQGRLPMWPLQGNETYCMVGNPAATVLADAYLKGLMKKENIQPAYEAILHTAQLDSLGMKWVRKLQYIPADSMEESVGWALEYAIADGAVARMAAKLEKKNDATYFKQRSLLFQKYYDRAVGFFNGRMGNGHFRRPFNPFSAKHREVDYVEGNAWQYLWLTPQAPHELIALLGGEKHFTQKLDSLFLLPSILEAGASPDIDGLIGQYAHGNEPSHHVTYLYAYVGQPWKTAEKIREITDKFYTTQPDGLTGNEDVGQMSAWYVLSALGFYSADPSSGKFIFGLPLIRQARIRTNGNTYFTIDVKNQVKGNNYIEQVLWNGHNYTKSYFSYADLMKGGKMIITLGSKPSPVFGVAAKDRP